MKKASLHSIFWIALIVSLSFLIAYIYLGINAKNNALLVRDLKEKIDKGSIPVFEIRDISYEEAGTVASLSFNLINMGSSLPLNGWILQFLTPEGKMICRTTIFTGDPTEASRIFTEVTVPTRNATLEYGDALYPGDVAEVSIQLLSTCLNETINYARTGEKMVVRLTIPPTSSSVITTCKIDASTGYASCYG